MTATTSSEVWGDGSNAMNAFETLMWKSETASMLRSTCVAIDVLESVPDWDAFVATHQHAIRLVPRLRQRVVDAPLGLALPRWTEDPNFDLHFHLRRMSEFSTAGETVWSVGRDQHLIAAFYRNSVLHVFLGRAITELALLRLAEKSGDATGAVAGALALRELLKFDFFFAGRDAFLDELRVEVEILADAPVHQPAAVSSADAELWLGKAELLVAPLVLRPFLDAYRVLAHQLADLGDAPLTDSEQLVSQALRTGHQWALRRRIASEESVSGEMYRTALKLAAHRDLLDGADLGERRRAFVREIDEVAAAIGRLGEVSR